MYDPQPNKEIQMKCEVFYKNHDYQIIKKKYMTFHHDEREDLWRMIWDIRCNPVKTPQERQLRETSIDIIMKEIEELKEPDLCSWKHMHDFIMYSNNEKTAAVYESCKRALDAAANRMTARRSVIQKGSRTRKGRRNMSVKSRETCSGGHSNNYNQNRVNQAKNVSFTNVCDDSLAQEIIMEADENETPTLSRLAQLSGKKKRTSKAYKNNCIINTQCN